MKPQARRVIAVFDFDGTLTRRDTSFPFIAYAAGRVSLRWNLLVAGLLTPIDLLAAMRREWAGPVNERLGSVHGAFEMLFHQRVLRGSLRGRKLSELQRLGREWAAGEMQDFLVEAKLARLAWHRERGDSCFLVSASIDVYLTDWGERLGFENVLASRLAVEGGVFTGRFEGPPCWGRIKLHRLQSVLGDLGGCEVYVYGDSRGDRDILAAADHAFIARGDSLIPLEEIESL